VIIKLGKKVPAWAVKHDLAILKRLDLVESQGMGRGAFWCVKKNK
jgi:hypothetical protein